LATTIEKLGGKAVMPKKPDDYGFPVSQLKSQSDVLKFAAGLEKVRPRPTVSVIA